MDLYDTGSGAKNSKVFNQKHTEELEESIKPEHYRHKPPRKTAPIPIEVIQQTTMVHLGCKFCHCFEPQICINCHGLLCQKCKKGCCMQYNICRECYAQLCEKCRKNFKAKKTQKKNKISLRNYPIRLKDLKTLHFEDCECKNCIPHKNIED